MFNLFPLGSDDVAVSGSADDDGDVVLLPGVSKKASPKIQKEKHLSQKLTVRDESNCLW